MQESNWDSLIAGLRSGDEQAYEAFWNEFGDLLQSVAEKQLSQRLQRRVGSDDIVQSACRTFFRRVSVGQFDLPDSEALWRLLCSITLNKARRASRDHLRKKRGMDRELHMNAVVNDSEREHELENRGEQPIDVASVADEMSALLSGLSEQHCQVLDLKLQQFTNDEIAGKLQCSERSVRRIIAQLKERWTKMERED